MNPLPQLSTVVLVHGAWADGSCWSNVIVPLRDQGLKVIAAPIPLTSLTDDTAALRRVIERTTGPVILAGHAYAGAVLGSRHVYCAKVFHDLQTPCPFNCRFAELCHKASQREDRVASSPGERL